MCSLLSLWFNEFSRVNRLKYFEAGKFTFMRYDFNLIYLRKFRAAICPAHNQIDRNRIAMHDSLHRTIAAVAYPACNCQELSFTEHRVAEVNTLYTPVNNKAKSYFCRWPGSQFIFLCSPQSESPAKSRWV